MHDPHILAVTETWLSSTITDSEIIPPSHKILRRDRDGRGGGVAIITKNEVDCTELERIPNHESIFCKINFRGFSTLFGVVYRPPKNPISDLEAVTEYLGRVLKNEQKLILTGDFNLPGIDWNKLAISGSHDTDSARLLLETAFCHDMQQIVHVPTRVTETSRSTLDLVFVKNFSEKHSVTTENGIADHKLVTVGFDVNKTKRKVTSRKFRDFLASDDVSILDCLHLGLSDFSPGDNVSTLWSKFKTLVLSCIDRFVPLRQRTTKRNNPWITREIIHLKRRIARRRKSKLNYGSDFSTLKQELTAKLRCARSRFHNQTLPLFLKEAPQKFWRFLSGAKCGIEKLKINGVVVTNPERIANELNFTFHGSFTDPHSVSSISTLLPPCATMPDLGFSREGIFDLLLKIKTKKASGPDGLPNAFLYRYAEVISEYLYIIFNASVDEASLPMDWMLAKIIPVFKAGDKLSPTNYRPISLISTCCKLIEHVIASHISNYLEANQFFVEYQHGFRKHVSTVTQLVSVVHDFASAIDKQQQIDAIFLDLSKAFDRVPHVQLVERLKEVGIPQKLVRWIEAYLSKRMQFVECNGSRSNVLPVLSGVPQGSVLGPLFFLIFINDIGKHIDENVQVKLFADDCILYSVIDNCDSQVRLNNNLCKLADWCGRNGMLINFSKTVSMTITNIKNPLIHCYQIGTRHIKTVSSVKYLGLTITNNLNWDAHYDDICSRAFRKLCFLRRKLRRSPKKVKLEAYRTLIRPVLEYGSIVWCPHYTKHIEKIERIQRLAARFIASDYRLRSSVTNMLKQLELEPLQKRRQIAKLKFLYLLYHKKIGMNSDTYLLPAPHTSARLNHSKTIRPLFAHAKIFQKSFFPCTIEHWNALPSDFVECCDVNSFERMLSSFL